MKRVLLLSCVVVLAACPEDREDAEDAGPQGPPCPNDGDVDVPCFASGAWELGTGAQLAGGSLVLHHDPCAFADGFAPPPAFARVSVSPHGSSLFVRSFGEDFCAGDYDCPAFTQVGGQIFTDSFGDLAALPNSCLGPASLGDDLPLALWFSRPDWDGDGCSSVSATQVEINLDPFTCPAPGEIAIDWFNATIHTVTTAPTDNCTWEGNSGFVIVPGGNPALDVTYTNTGDAPLVVRVSEGILGAVPPSDVTTTQRICVPPGFVGQSSWMQADFGDRTCRTDATATIEALAFVDDPSCAVPDGIADPDFDLGADPSSPWTRVASADDPPLALTDVADTDGDGSPNVTLAKANGSCAYAYLSQGVRIPEGGARLEVVGHATTGSDVSISIGAGFGLRVPIDLGDVESTVSACIDPRLSGVGLPLYISVGDGMCPGTGGELDLESVRFVRDPACAASP